MPKIHQLSAQEIQKIAAGEVIDRPANIVKELVENSLDAGATHIKICIEDGGKKLVRVIDNGCGMEPDDAKLCFAHHATSKITSLNDLEHCITHGFRGEALSSIASVSHITIVTKPEMSQLGTKLILIDGTINNESVVSANMGTDLSIADLFYNIPARKKFLKTKETEWRQILRLVQAYCLEYSHIHFELFSNEDSIINCPPTKSMESRVAQIWDYDMSNAMLPISISDEHQKITIQGLISHHHYARYDRSNIFMFVNHRWIKNQHLCKAFLKGYTHVLPPARYPVCALSITVEPATVDINIHPRKEEVKFLHPHAVEALLHECVKKRLEQHLEKKINTQHNQAFPQPEPALFESDNFTSRHNRYGATPTLQPTIERMPAPLYSRLPAFDSITLPQKELCKEEIAKPNSATLPDNTQLIKQERNLNIAEPTIHEELASIIGQYKNTYIIIEEDAGLLLIDQHAAHERILYEQFAARFEDIATVRTLFPCIINVTTEDLSLIEPQFSILHSHGIQVEPFGQQQLAITATPVHMQHVDISDLVRQFISWLRNDEQPDMNQHLNNKLRALMACKAAVKAGDILSHIQMQQIIKDLRHTTNKLTCPHGRPTGWTIEHHEIEKKFKRDYRPKILDFDSQE